jgi:hypothetical protein
MAGKFELVNGHENTIAINVISTFLLALMILPKLQETAKTFSTVSDLTIVASDMHYLSNVGFITKETPTGRMSC